MSAATKVLFAPVNLVVSIAGGLVAGAVFTRVWAKLGPSDEAPKPNDLDHSNREVFLAAAAHGVVYGLVKAAVSRASAKGYRRVVGEDPVDQG